MDELLLHSSFHEYVREDLRRNRTLLNTAREKVEQAQSEVDYFNNLLQQNKRDCLKYGVDPNV